MSALEEASWLSNPPGSEHILTMELAKFCIEGCAYINTVVLEAWIPTTAICNISENAVFYLFLLFSEIIASEIMLPFFKTTLYLHINDMDNYAIDERSTTHPH